MIISTWKIVFPLTLCLALNVLFTEANSGLLQAKKQANHKRNDDIHSYRKKYMGSSMDHQSQFEQMKYMQQMQQYQQIQQAAQQAALQASQQNVQQMQYYPQQMQSQQSYVTPQQATQMFNTAPAIAQPVQPVANKYKADVMNPPTKAAPSIPKYTSSDTIKNLVALPNQKPKVQVEITAAEKGIYQQSNAIPSTNQVPMNSVNTQYQAQAPTLPYNQYSAQTPMYNQYQAQTPASMYNQYPAQTPASMYNQYPAQASTSLYNQYSAQAQPLSYNQYPAQSQAYNPYSTQTQYAQQQGYNQYAPQQQGYNQYNPQQQGYNQYAPQQQGGRKQGKRGGGRRKQGRGQGQQRSLGGGQGGQGGQEPGGTAAKMMQAKAQARGKMASGGGQNQRMSGKRQGSQNGGIKNLRAKQVGGAGAKMLQAKQQHQGGRNLRRNPKNDGRRQLKKIGQNQKSRDQVSSETIASSFNSNRNRKMNEEPEYDYQDQQDYDYNNINAVSEEDYYEQPEQNIASQKYDNRNSRAKQVSKEKVQKESDSKSDSSSRIMTLRMTPKVEIEEQSEPVKRQSFREFRANNFRKNLGNVEAAEKYLHIRENLPKKEKSVDDSDIIMPHDELMALIHEHEKESHKESSNSNTRVEERKSDQAEDSNVFQSAYFYDENSNILDVNQEDDYTN